MRQKEKCFLFHLLPTLPSLLDTALLDPVLCLFINRLSRSFGLFFSLGSADRTSPAESFMPSPKCRPVFWSILNSTYCCAARDNGMGAGCVGISAPFCNRSSATGNGFRSGVGVVGRGVCIVGLRPGDDTVEPLRWCMKELDGDAGSAAASARKTAWVPRDRSAAFGLARSANAYKTCWMLFCLILASSVSSGFLKWANVSVRP